MLNDYLGMGHHPVVREAMHKAIDDGATGAGGTRNIGGTNALHVELERLLATLHDKPAALTFTSGYSANLASLSVLGSLLPDTVILSDADNHNSMIEGIRRANSDRVIFEHNSPRDLKPLAAISPDRPKLVVFESVYSMSGNIAPSVNSPASPEIRRHDLPRRGARGGHVRQTVVVACRGRRASPTRST